MTKDILGNGFEQETLPLRDDYEGKVEATLVRKKTPTSAADRKAVLYVHGYVDYFFQAEMAARYLAQGLDFYALDLRKYGRSLLQHQTPNFCRDTGEYFEEIDQAITLIRQRDGVKKLLLSGHSTGGLIAALYAHQLRHDTRVQAVFLNSPFFQFNEDWFTKEVLLNLVGTVGRTYPFLEIPGGLSKLYGQSVHRDYHGEWDFDLTWKPIEGFPARAGWMRAILKAQGKLHAGLDIRCPILVMYSAASSTASKWDDRLLTTDSVLDVKDIARYSDGLGDQVTKMSIPGGMHDLVLSGKAVREKVYRELFGWLDACL